MSAKNVDRKNRFRSITVGFRVSPEENEALNKAVALSGLPKQEYCYRKCIYRKRTRVQHFRRHALQHYRRRGHQEMAEILSELKRINKADEMSDELLDIIELVSVTLIGLKGENTNE